MKLIYSAFPYHTDTQAQSHTRTHTHKKAQTQHTHVLNYYENEKGAHVLYNV